MTLLRHELEAKLGRELAASLRRPMVLIRRRSAERWLLVCRNGALVVLGKGARASSLFVVTAYWPDRTAAYWHPEPWQPAADSVLTRYAPFPANDAEWTILTPETWGLYRMGEQLLPGGSYPAWEL